MQEPTTPDGTHESVDNHPESDATSREPLVERIFPVPVALDSLATDRRTLLRGTAAGVLASLPGCSLLVDDQTYEAAPVRLADDAEARGYGLVGTSTPEVTRSFELADAEREVTIRSHYTAYEHRAGIAVGLLSTPAISEAGQSLNPIATDSLEALLTEDTGAEYVQQLKIESDWARGPEPVGHGTGQILNQSTEFTTFAGVTEANVFVLLNAARIEHKGDALLVGLAWQTETSDPERPFVGQDGYVTQVLVDGTAEDFADLLGLVRYGTEPQGPVRPSRDSSPQPLIENPTDDENWKVLSVQLAEARIDGEPTRINEDLREAAEAASTPGLAMVFEFWAAENHTKAGNFETAVDRYDDLLDRFDEPVFLDMEFRGAILRKRATAEEELGRIDDALSTYDELVEETSGIQARPHYRKGLAAERAGKDDIAIRAYENAARADDPHGHHLAGLDVMGLRAAERVKNPFDGFYTAEERLRHRIVDLLAEGAYDELAALASPTHFTVGPAGGCKGFVDTEGVVEQFVADAEQSDITVGPEDVTLAGASVYLPTQGWEGERFEGKVYFELSESPQGWSWEGIGVWEPGVIEWLDENPELTGTTPGLRPKEWPSPTPSPSPTASPTPTPTPEPTPQPKTTKYPAIDIAAPFDHTQKFRAGGYPLGSGGGCGTGIAGYYYKQGPTHRSSRGAKHAIDFTQYLGKWGTISAKGKRVHSTNHGVVDTVVEKYKNGSNNGANKVEVDHLSKNRCGVYADYRSKYLHLTGKYDVPTSKGAHVKEGSLLGYMDNSGHSVVHHLHFNVRNKASDESVRPSPMNGQHLSPSDAGKCVDSDNVRSFRPSDYTHTEPSCD